MDDEVGVEPVQDALTSLFSLAQHPPGLGGSFDGDEPPSPYRRDDRGRSHVGGGGNVTFKGAKVNPSDGD